MGASPGAAVDSFAELFVRTLHEYRAHGKYLLHEFVVMPDHVHLLITVGSQITIERAVQFIKGGFAFRAGRECGIRPPIWQKRFSEIRVNDSVSFARQREYIRNNPVSAFLATPSGGIFWFVCLSRECPGCTTPAAEAARCRLTIRHG